LGAEAVVNCGTEQHKGRNTNVWGRGTLKRRGGVKKCIEKTKHNISTHRHRGPNN